jgi:hypothetical protein
VLSNEVHGFARRYPVKDGEAREGGAGSAASAAACDLDPLRRGSVPRLAQGVFGINNISWQLKAGPPDQRASHGTTFGLSPSR